MKILQTCFIFFVACIFNANSSIIDISSNKWKLWLDREAPVKADASQPTCGWGNLFGKGIDVKLPATVEEHFWGDGDGGRFGLSGDYTGVSWFSTLINVPEIDSNKRLLLKFESVRLCAEVFVNEKFVGRDELFGTPFFFDITDYVNKGEGNKLSVKIIDPDGNFTWTDFNPHFWNERKITPSHGFGGITGKVRLEIVDNNYISDVFIKNTPEITSVETEVTINNLLNKHIPDGELEYSLVSVSDTSKV